jgi:predicted RNA binding protein YcfA (HicA-like mRNA interferase family)
MGMDRLPLAKGEKHVAAFKRAGWRPDRKMRGSHRVLRKAGFQELLTIPCNRKDVKRPLLAKLIKIAGLTEEEYLAYFTGKQRD